jgi:hypothetical protein
MEMIRFCSTSSSQQIGAYPVYKDRQRDTRVIHRIYIYLLSTQITAATLPVTQKYIVKHTPLYQKPTHHAAAWARTDQGCDPRKVGAVSACVLFQPTAAAGLRSRPNEVGGCRNEVLCVGSTAMCHVLVALLCAGSTAMCW